MTLYKQSSSKIWSLNSIELILSNTAVTELNKKLEVVNSKEILQWKGNLDKTENSIRFIRNFDINIITGDKLEFRQLKCQIYL